MVPHATQSPLHQAATTGTGCVILGSQIASNEAGFLVPLSLPQLIIGKNVKTIGKKTFYGCKKLKKITIKSRLLTAKNCGEKAFFGIHKKVTINVPTGKKKSYKKLLRKKGIGENAVITSK